MEWEGKEDRLGWEWMEVGEGSTGAEGEGMEGGGRGMGYGGAGRCACRCAGRSGRQQGRDEVAVARGRLVG